MSSQATTRLYRCPLASSTTPTIANVERLLLILLIICGLTFESKGVEALSTLPFGPDPNTIGIADAHDLFAGVFSAQSIVTGSAAALVDSITLEQLFYDEGSVPSLRVRVYKEANPYPVYPDPDMITLVGQLGGPVIDTITPNPFAPFTKFVRYFPEAPILLEPNTVYYLGPYIPLDSSDTAPLMYNFNYNFQGLADWQLFPPFSWWGFDNGSGGFGWQPAQTIKFRLEVTLQNQPPDCSRARPSVASIWPPTLNMTSIQIMDVTDADGDPVSIVITGITQDEPVIQPMESNPTSPDGAGVGTSVATVRAERAGTGNGRVYRISFTASDNNGGTSSGTVYVGVRHDQNSGPAVDSGAVYDSTVH